MKTLQMGEVTPVKLKAGVAQSFEVDYTGWVQVGTFYTEEDPQDGALVTVKANGLDYVGMLGRSTANFQSKGRTVVKISSPVSRAVHVVLKRGYVVKARPV